MSKNYDETLIAYTKTLVAKYKDGRMSEERFVRLTDKLIEWEDNYNAKGAAN